MEDLRTRNYLADLATATNTSLVPMAFDRVFGWVMIACLCSLTAARKDESFGLVITCLPSMSISRLIQHARGPAHAPALYQDSNIARTAPQGSEWQGVRSRGSKSLGPILTSARPELACVL